MVTSEFNFSERLQIYSAWLNRKCEDCLLISKTIKTEFVSEKFVLLCSSLKRFEMEKDLNCIALNCDSDDKGCHYMFFPTIFS